MVWSVNLRSVRYLTPPSSHGSEIMSRRLFLLPSSDSESHQFLAFVAGQYKHLQDRHTFIVDACKESKHLEMLYDDFSESLRAIEAHREDPALDVVSIANNTEEELARYRYAQMVALCRKVDKALGDYETPKSRRYPKHKRILMAAAMLQHFADEDTWLNRKTFNSEGMVERL